MNDFTASNGIRVLSEDGVTFDLRTYDGASMLQDAPWLGSMYMHALREFFQVEADERLGRWRHGDFIVYDRGDYVQVIHEPDGASGILGSWTRAEASGDRELSSGFGEAARAYFDAHPEPKPWHDAAPGEVWDVDLPSGGMRAVTFYSARHEEPITVFRDAHTQVEIETDDPTIRDARCLFSETRRIWLGESS